MRFLFDQNISHRILKLIPDNYSDSTTVKKEGLINAPEMLGPTNENEYRSKISISTDSKEEEADNL